MNILFETDKERAFFEDFKLLRKRYGNDLAKLITRRIIEIESHDSVGDLLSSGIGKGHYLKGNYKNCIALNLTGNYRLIIRPFLGEDIDISQLNNYRLTIVTILKVEDYHGK
ncbi:hypothetical protein [Bacillus altitudinis]|uniref:hypothetical protein n=1 Tax=Bacillus altitudinis TaxID=293387 RepID=UPI0011B45A5C|nr:hypothetical protein [Bacillus altitudinis]QDZ95922.1 hypothetical protein D0438_13535 [Bacillus altitudinis]